MHNCRLPPTRHTVSATARTSPQRRRHHRASHPLAHRYAIRASMCGYDPPLRTHPGRGMEVAQRLQREQRRAEVKADEVDAVLGGMVREGSSKKPYLM